MITDYSSDNERNYKFQQRDKDVNLGLDWKKKSLNSFLEIIL
jgi:hypothetical protein